MKTFFKFYIFVCLFSLGVVAAQTVHREVKKTDEKEVHVKIESSFGSVNIEKGNEEKVVRVHYRRKDKGRDPNLNIDYSVHKGIGELYLEMHPEGSEVRSSDDGDGGVHVNADVNFHADEWYVELVEGIPLYLDVELGAGKSDFDLTGLMVNDLSISTGASSSKLDFDEMNRGEIKNLRIESGVSKFVANNLNNANFRKLDFEGGVGTYYLDFGGELKRDVKVDINVGLGTMTVAVPRNIGLKIRYEDSWLSNLSLDDDEFVRKKKGIYESQNYYEAEGKMDISIESGLGNVKIKRTR
ncbi:MAG: LiaF domain-containing protein [Bacteriovoracaceae bacterium]|nr:cell wall-active antibiotics response protein [Bacteroidota bacterium]